MSKVKFTNGEWEVVDGTLVGEQVLFVHVKGKGVVCRLTRQVGTHIPLSDEDKANAHLIAAAPEMYYLLEKIAVSMECFHGVDTESTFNLLAKARGEK